MSLHSAATNVRMAEDGATTLVEPFAMARGTFEDQFPKSLPDPMPVVNAYPTGADLSNFEDEDGSTDDGQTGLLNGENPAAAASYYRMPFLCPSIPTVPFAATHPANQVTDLNVNVTSISRHTEELKCFCCHEPVAKGSEPITTDCSHHFDVECFELIVRLAIKTVSLPTCCGELIPTRRFLHRIPYDLKRSFLEKEMEMMIEPKDRLYCPNPRCLAFIGDISDADTLTMTCLSCSLEVCTRCRRETHSSLMECRSSEEDPEIINMGQRKGWQRCYNCRSMVEIMDGCNHITCRCSAEFCYQCGKPWLPRSCECGVFPADHATRD